MDWDDGDLNLKFEINLENMTAIALATFLWENEETDEEIMSFFGDWKQYDIFRQKELTWKDVTSKVCDRAKTLNLPKELLTKVENSIFSLGFQIRAWNYYVRNTLNLPSHFGGLIFWTNYGTVSENDIFKHYWKERYVLKIDSDHSSNFVIFLSCIFAQVWFINQHLEEIKKVTELRIAPAKFKSRSYTAHAIIAMWLCIYITRSKKQGVDRYCKAQKSDTISSELLTMCIDNGFIEAAKYFWSKLNLNEKIKFTAYECGKKVLDSLCGYYSYYDNVFDIENDHQRVKKTELLIFFINKMSTDEKVQFVSENMIKIFNMCKYWPFHEILIKLVTDDRMLKNVDPNELYYDLFSKTIDIIVRDYSDGRFIDKDFCRQILPTVLERIPKEIKQAKIFSSSWFSNQNFSPSDILIISTIFNDKDLADSKIKIVEQNKLKFKNLIKSKNLDKLNEFALIVFPLDDERKEFKLKMNFVFELILENNFKLANELLDWISDSDEERKNLKNQIDPINVFSATSDVVILNEFLSWRYNEEEERKSAKQILRQNDFLTVKIIKMWSKMGGVDEKKCSEYLKWLTDDDINAAMNFKPLLTIDENFLRKFWENLYSLKLFKRTNELLRFFSLTPLEIRKIKENLIESMDEWILTYVVTIKNFKLAEAIMDWACDLSQKKKSLEKYINSSNGALLLLKTWMSCGLNYGEAMVFLLDEWVRLAGNISVIKEKLEEMVLNDFWERTARFTLIDLLDNLVNRGRDITTKTLARYF